MNDLDRRYQSRLYVLLAPLGVGAALVWVGDIRFSIAVAAVFDAYSLLLLALVDPGRGGLRIRVWAVVLAAALWLVGLYGVATPLIWPWLALALAVLYWLAGRRGTAVARAAGDAWRATALRRAGLFAIWCHISVWVSLVNDYNTLS